MEIKKFLLSFNNLSSYLFLSIVCLVFLVVYFYIINPK
ncbi:hypothetical protein [uncultured Acinetobacter sp.]|nr:hypothetical protein [uncultured Acinetobacter sp.]